MDKRTKLASVGLAACILAGSIGIIADLDAHLVQQRETIDGLHREQKTAAAQIHHLKEQSGNVKKINAELQKQATKRQQQIKELKATISNLKK